MARVVLLGAVLATSACAGIQSSLAPAGREAERIAQLYWWMAAGAIVIWLGVVALGWHYGRPHEASENPRRDRWLIVGSGVIFPLVVLTALLAYGLSMLPPLIARAPAGSLLIEVDGEMWWWRVRYHGPDGTVTEVANEVRLPVGEPVQFQLASRNVIHSFWIPALGGKMDMIPGRINYLTLHPTATGVFAGACAEYCGTSHGYMRFFVEVMERPAFAAWLAAQQAPAAPPATPIAARGQELLLANGCGACHTVRGTAARGVIAPDLTHVGSRMSLAAGTLPNETAPLVRWLSAPQRVKPGVHMPPYHMIGDDEVRALAAYLEGLR